MSLKTETVILGVVSSLISYFLLSSRYSPFKLAAQTAAGGDSQAPVGVTTAYGGGMTVDSGGKLVGVYPNSQPTGGSYNGISLGPGGSYNGISLGPEGVVGLMNTIYPASYPAT